MKPHYERIRKVKTKTGATAIQIGFYKGKRFKLIKHVGSSKDQDKINELLSIADAFIRSRSPQLAINFNSQSDEILFKRGIRVSESILSDAFIYLENIYDRVGFTRLENDLLKHFAIIRVLEPASKAKSLILLQKYFNITYRKTTAFRGLEQLIALKEKAVQIAIDYAKKHLNFDFSLVFYDVTTLYFETHKQDEFRRNGFSKDNKINQPQILIGLVVNNNGFPLYYDIFKGNTFEGKTIIPVIKSIKETYGIEQFTIIADAGMLSEKNLEELTSQHIDYVVGARLGYLSIDAVKEIAEKLSKTDKKIVSLGEVLYDYSDKRAKKDKADTDKQIEKANYYLKNPAKVLRRTQFLTSNGNNEFSLNNALVERHRLLEGIKGYKTNIKTEAPELLIARYKDLWRIEQSFRIAKSDLEARPIYHRKETSIKYHILIVFIALCMSRVIEMEKGVSIQKVTDELKDKWTLTLTDEISGNSLKILLDKKPH